MSRSISWNYFFGGYNCDEADYCGRHPIKTWGCFCNGNEARYGSNFHTAVFGIPYDQELQDIDRLHFELELASAKSEEERMEIRRACASQLWWRRLEARPVWTRLPAFLHAWLRGPHPPA